MLLTWNKARPEGTYRAEWKQFRLKTWTHRKGGKWPGEIAKLNEFGIVCNIVYEHLVYPTSLEESQEILETELKRYLYDRLYEAEVLCTQFSALERETWENEST